uniref:DUF4821 domain-containing protein n=1 Tax=Mesocestoides corti TaxID=53468 RepID=A0A5K3F7U9_MESCO
MKIHNFRRTEALDIIHIQALIENDKIFARTKINLFNLLERGLLSLTAVGPSGDVV